VSVGSTTSGAVSPTAGKGPTVHWATGFVAAGCFAGAFLAGAFFFAAFLAGAFFTAAFLAGAFFTAAFRAGAFFTAAFLAGAFFFAATSRSYLVNRLNRVMCQKAATPSFQLIFFPSA
jgi:hypothetical protein